MGLCAASPATALLGMGLCAASAAPAAAPALLVVKKSPLTYLPEGML